ncbi:MAG TPA: acyl-CoA dehydrogenase family protein [Steroidobacteraceae bacterium]|nr:acyl-CoA dehydrogenase family protein [Steroidobacteraceae bacterium]
MRRRIFEPEHELFREQARRFFLEQVQPNAARWREQGHVDREAFLAAGEQGYLLMWADEKYGGAGVTDFRYEQILCEENIRHGEPGFFMTAHSRLMAPYLGHFGTEEQRRRWLPECVKGSTILGIAMTEPDAGSDLAGIRTRAEPQGEDWILNGAKTYISNGQIADLVIVVARTVPDSRHGLGLFLVERDMPGFRRGRNLHKMGLQAQDTSELFFDGVRLSKRHVLGDPAKGFQYLTRLLAEERLISATMSLAAAQAAFDLTLEFIMNRRAFGRPIGTFQNARFRMADMRTQLDGAQCFLDSAVLEHNAGALSPELAAEVKLLTSELEARVVDECVQLHGSAGYMSEYRISRYYTDARISRIYAGTSEIMREIIGRSLGLDERKLK